MAWGAPLKQMIKAGYISLFVLLYSDQDTVV